MFWFPLKKLGNHYILLWSALIYIVCGASVAVNAFLTTQEDAENWKKWKLAFADGMRLMWRLRIFGVWSVMFLYLIRCIVSSVHVHWRCLLLVTQGISTFWFLGSCRVRVCHQLCVWSHHNSQTHHGFKGMGFRM